MDEQRIREIIREVLQLVAEEKNLGLNAPSSHLPKAYFIFPEGWQKVDGGTYLPLLQAVEGRYERVLVLPQRDVDETIFSNVGAYTVAVPGDLYAPAGESITVFPIANRDLVIKTALCLSEDFEGRWIRQCMETGTRVYMKKENAMFTGKEPVTYRKKILSYYQDVRSYGICFTDGEELRGSGLQQTKNAQRKKRYITMQDLRDVPQNGTFTIRAGDVLTALAKEHAEKSGICIVEE